ncbi:hypothetical protein ED312_14625 [Sinomicrobium pectinilyticum]|uniref:Uncharacterized protein n=1 Tax=Sinomicrobium pectinilyticum TaxID=1084421 RepID=A0A3N0E7A2_SINP1|nr:hypothetical protein ED312_14625 [Sinomicrobium pectinilyticum]
MVQNTAGHCRTVPTLRDKETLRFALGEVRLFAFQFTNSHPKGRWSFPFLQILSDFLLAWVLVFILNTLITQMSEL